MCVFRMHYEDCSFNAPCQCGMKRVDDSSTPTSDTAWIFYNSEILRLPYYLCISDVDKDMLFPASSLDKLLLYILKLPELET